MCTLQRTISFVINVQRFACRGLKNDTVLSPPPPPLPLRPMQVAFSRKFARVRQCVTTLTDDRVKLTNQAVTGARLMKMNAWEPALENEIRRQGGKKARKGEKRNVPPHTLVAADFVLGANAQTRLG